MHNIKELETFSALIDLIYQGATDPARWDTILAALSDYVEAPCGFLVTPMHGPPSGGYMYAHNVPAGVFENWPKFVEHDVYAQTAADRGLFKHSGAVVTGEDLISRDKFHNSIFYRDFLSHYDMAQMSASIVFGTDEPDLLPTTCTFYRGYKDETFSEVARHRQRLIIPHLSRALGVMQRLRSADLKVAASRSTLNMLNVGVFLVDADGHVIFSNRHALRIMREEDGLRLRHRSGAKQYDELWCSDPKIQLMINAALRTAISPDVLATPHFSKSLAVPKLSRSPPYALNFSSLPSHNEFGTGNETPRAIVFLTDSEQPLNLNTDYLQTTYGLTRAEVRTAVMLTSGDTCDDIAREIGIRVSTLKTQMRQIYVKTGVDNRAKLVRLLFSLSKVS